MSQGYIIPEISALGRTGVRRLLYGDFTSTKEDIVISISEEKWVIQPEAENLMLTELTIG